MFSIKIRDHIMIAHSLSESFGPAAGLHGATYVVNVSFFSEKLNNDNVVIDIGIASDVLKKCLDPLRYRNLDELPQFKGEITTTEYLARYIHGIVKDSLSGTFSGAIRVTLDESHIASASYQA